MNIFKCIQILAVLFPVCLLGMEQGSKTWIKEALSCFHAGVWTTQDKKDKSVIVEGEVISRDSKIISSGAYLKILSNQADVMQVPDSELIKSNPLALLNPLVWGSALKMLFQRKSLRDILYDEYIKEINKILSRKDENLSYLFTVSELQQNGEKLLLGSIMFGIEKSYAYGNVERFHTVVKPEARDRGLGKILSSAIFKLLPQVKRIFLEVLRTNNTAIRADEAYGFTKCGEHWYFLNYEYLTKKCSKLQDVVAKFKDIKN